MAEHWQPFEEEFLLKFSSEIHIDDICEKLERSRRAIVARAGTLGVKKIKGAPAFPKQIRRRYRRLIPRTYWSQRELALFFTHSNEQIAEITGRSLQKVSDRRLYENLKRNGWLYHDPEDNR